MIAHHSGTKYLLCVITKHRQLIKQYYYRERVLHAYWKRVKSLEIIVLYSKITPQHRNWRRFPCRTTNSAKMGVHRVGYDKNE